MPPTVDRPRGAENELREISDQLPSVAIDQGRRAVTEVGGLHGRRAAKTLEVR